MRHPLAVLVLAAALALAGCVGDAGDDAASTGTGDPQPGASSSPTGNASDDADLANTSDEGNLSDPVEVVDGGTSDPDPTPSFRDPTVVARQVGAEPMLDVAPDGTIYLTGTGAEKKVDEPVYATGPAQSIWRSTDDGASWTDVTPPLPTANGTGVDNALVVGGDGTVHYANAAGGVLELLRSTDQGETWLPTASFRFPAPMHRTWLAPRDASEVNLFVEGLDSHNWYHRSEDSGRTWTPPVPVNRRALTFGSDLAVDSSDGTLYRASQVFEVDPAVDETHWHLHRSTDGGTTWEILRMFPVEHQLTGSWHSLEVSPEGTLYMAWSAAWEGRSLVTYAYSTDGGESWSDPRPLAPEEGTTQALPWLDVRGPGEVGAVWYEAQTQGLPGDVDAAWNVTYALVDEADTRNATAYRTQVTDGAVHHGNICGEGPRCGEGEDRSLLDFTWVEFGPQDRAHLAFASTDWDQPDSFPLYAGEKTPFTPP